MTVEVTTGESDGIPVVWLRGVASPGLLDCLVDGIQAVSEAVSAVVVDIEELVLTDALTVRGFVAKLESGTHAAWAVSCGRLSGRRVLRRCGVDVVSIFSSPAEAAAALRFAVAS
jgi:hypothetical protein